MVTADPRKHLAEYVRGLFESHTLTVRNIVAGMSDEGTDRKMDGSSRSPQRAKAGPGLPGTGKAARGNRNIPRWRVVN